MEEKIKLRDKLADIALQWQASFGVAPSITSSISEYDAAMLIGMSEKEYYQYFPVDIFHHYKQAKLYLLNHPLYC